MPGLQGLISNLRAAARHPRAWRLARESVKRRGAIQHIDELSEFAAALIDRPPRTVLEIGTAQGGVFWLLCRLATPDATLISLDLPPDERLSGGEHVAIDLQAMKQPGQAVHAVLASSHEPDTLARVRSLLAGRPLDVLFIDGDHTYDGVRQDYQMYAPLVRTGGVVAFHDIVRTPWPECQVDRFWGELAQDRSLQPRAIVGSVPSHFGGIGLVTAR
jgi:predicted O-methyltransferase YrrM